MDDAGLGIHVVEDEIRDSDLRRRAGAASATIVTAPTRGVLRPDARSAVPTASSQRFRLVTADAPRARAEEIEASVRAAESS